MKFPADIVVTTPIPSQWKAEQEALQMIKAGGGEYFRRLGVVNPRFTSVGSRIYYVESNFIVGFLVITKIEYHETEFTCSTTGAVYKPGFYAFMPADSWNWIKPLPMKSFQGFRYMPHEESKVKILGNWLDKRPNYQVC